MKTQGFAALIMALAWGGAAEAEGKQGKSALVQSLESCRANADDAARLRCYDSAAAALIAATAQGNVVVVDQRDLREARRSLFGFSVPKLPFFRGDESAGGQESEIAGKISSAHPSSDGKWQITLEDGARWAMTEVWTSARLPKSGNDVVIKRGALGSYTMTIAGGRSVKVKRVG